MHFISLYTENYKKTFLDRKHSIIEDNSVLQLEQIG